MNSVKKIFLVTSLLLGCFSAWSAEYNFDFQSSDAKGSNTYKLAQEWAKGVETASNGRIKITVYPTGGAVGYNETLDAMRLGLIDGHMAPAGYFASIDPAFNLLNNTIGAWESAEQASDFMNNAGGAKILASLYAQHGVQLIGTYSEELEAFVSSKPMNGVDDINGLRIRVADDLTDAIFTAFGAKTVQMSFTKVPAAIGQGILDAADASMLSVNHGNGFHETGPHSVYPGFHSLNVKDVSMGKKQWDSLPNDLKQILKASVIAFDKTYTQSLRDDDAKALSDMKSNPTITIHDWSADERKKFRQMSQKYWKQFSEKSDASKQVYEKLVSYLENNQLL